MIAKRSTIQKVAWILRNYMPEETARLLVARLLDDTVPSGNKSYDETIRRLSREMMS